MVESSASPAILVISFSLAARLSALGWTHQWLASLPSSMGTKLRAQRDKGSAKTDRGSRKRRENTADAAIWLAPLLPRSIERSHLLVC